MLAVEEAPGLWATKSNVAACERLRRPIPSSLADAPDICRRIQRRPKASSCEGIAVGWLLSFLPPARQLRLDQKRLQGEPSKHGSDQGCPPKYDAFVPLPSCPGRSPVAPLFCRLYALTIDDACAWMRITPSLLPHPSTKIVMDRFPQSRSLPTTEAAVHGLPGWEILGEHPPLDPATRDVKNGVHDDAPIMFGRPSTASVELLDNGSDIAPLTIRQIAGVRGFAPHPNRRSRSDRHVKMFQNSL